MKKRVFNKGPGSHTRSIRTTAAMESALAFLSQESGESINRIIQDMIDDRLQDLAKQGEVPWPEGVDKSKVS